MTQLLEVQVQLDILAKAVTLRVRRSYKTAVDDKTNASLGASTVRGCCAV